MRGGITAQRAARRRLQGTGDVVGLLEVGKDLDAPIVIGLADFGDADLPGGAVEKPRTEPVFQRLDMVAYHRGRHVETAACGHAASANVSGDLAQTTTAANTSEPAVSPKIWLAVASATLGAFMAVLNIQIVNASLAAIPGAIGARIAD